MKIYQIYIAELATFVKFKVLDPEDVTKFVESLSSKYEDKSSNEKYFSFRKEVIEHFIFNLKGEVSESLRMMSRKAAETCLDALFTGCIMLNPGLDIDSWVNLTYTPNSLNAQPSKDENYDGLPQSYFDFLKKNKGSTPKFDESDFPFGNAKKQTVKKIKQITKQKYIGLESHLRENVIGQNQAIETVVTALKRSQVGINDANRPIGVFLFAGSSGIGKTHLANILHKYLFGEDNPMVRIDCGEFQHKHENQKLIGSPPGYVGHEEGGQLVNLVKQNPSTVVLLDEVEKAHPDLWNTFLRVFDDGILTDGKGEVVDFRNTIIIMTTNLGNDKTTDHLLAGGTGFNKNINFKLGTKVVPERSVLERNTNDAIKKHFRPEFLNRIDKVVIFNFLNEDDCQQIAKLEMEVVFEKLFKKGYGLEYTDNVISALIDQGIDSIKGARALAQIRRDQIESKIADALITRSIPKGATFVFDYKDNSFKCKVQKPVKKTEVERKY